MKITPAFVVGVSLLVGCTFSNGAEPKWISLFNGKDLTGWIVRGKAAWSVQDGVLVGVGGMGHIYSDATCSDFEFKGMFRITGQGATANSGMYFRANPPADDPNGFPRGYEAQICNSGDAYTGWLWKPSKPTGRATELLTKDGEWFSYRIRAVGPHIQFWINDKPVMTYDDSEYKSGHFAIQGHNPGMKIEAKDLFYTSLAAENALEKPFPVRGFCIGAPSAPQVDRFVKFIHEELAPRTVNTLIVRIDYNFQYVSRPEVRDPSALGKADVKKIVEACRQHQIHLIPQINLLGHQSWANHVGSLLRAHPEFDETPWVKMPEKYAWPNPDRLYCKSYCPLHPEVHDVVFALIDEICEAFETDAFHAGMDEVFYIGEDKCPRCGGKSKAALFAGEVTAIHDHLAKNGRKLWIWGDRLLDGKTTGLGEWEASMNGTAGAIDLIPKDVVICDWHYERAEPTAAYFALKGFGVCTCPWKKGNSAVQQVRDLVRLREQPNPTLQKRALGLVQTVWSGANSFLNSFYAAGNGSARGRNEPSEAKCFVQAFDEIQALANASAQTRAVDRTQ